MFAATVITGLAIHGLLLLPFLYFFFLRRNPFKFYLSLTQAIITALGTDSSSATMPVSIKCCNEFGISTKTTQLVLPLGTTLNMNGTALYVGICWEIEG
jgi:Na+/H+-dicarboxylate symporter